MSGFARPIISNDSIFSLCSYQIFTDFLKFSKMIIKAIYFYYLHGMKNIPNQTFKTLIFVLYLECIYNKRIVQNKTKL